MAKRLVLPHVQACKNSQARFANVLCSWAIDDTVKDLLRKSNHSLWMSTGERI